MNKMAQMCKKEEEQQQQQNITNKRQYICFPIHTYI